MKELFEQIFIHLPEYISNFFQLFTKPKTFILAKANQFDEARASTLGEALSFAAVSYALIAILTAASWGDEFLKGLGKGLVSNLFFLIITASVLRLSWRIVGGKASFEKLLLASCFFLGVSIVLDALFRLLSTGIIKSFDAPLYAKFRAVADPTALITLLMEAFKDPIFIAFILVSLIGTILVGVWSFVGWGAYRQINELPKWKSALAFLVATVLDLPTFVVYDLIKSGL